MSADTFPRLFTRIDALTRPDHAHLGPEHVCYCLGEYTAGGGWEHSATNQLILNFRKPMDRKGRPEWKYKGRAIAEAAKAFGAALKDGDLGPMTFVPIPPSRANRDPLHDDRVMRMLRAVSSQSPLDCRELIVQTETQPPSHAAETEGGPRPEAGQIRKFYRINDKESGQDLKPTIALVDDLVVAGSHFRAARSFLQDHFPDRVVIGLFLARRQIPAPHATDFHP